MSLTLAVNPSKDTYAFLASPTTNYGTMTTVTMGVVAPGTVVYRGFLQFDLSAIPRSAIIESASLDIYVPAFLAAASAHEYEFVRCTRPEFVEDEMAWNIYSTGNDWTAGGGDLDDTVSDVFNAPTDDDAHHQIDVINNAADAVANRSGALAMIIRATNEGVARAQWYFSSVDDADDSTHPELTVIYSLSALRARNNLSCSCRSGLRMRA